VPFFSSFFLPPTEKKRAFSPVSPVSEAALISVASLTALKDYLLVIEND
jgi:hypothetical protein